MKIPSLIKESIHLQQSLLEDAALLENVNKIVALLSQTFREGRHVYFCGNGGSAADAQHLAAEFSGRFYKDRKALPAEALHCNTSYLTAVANDYGYDHIYARLIDGLGKSGDVLIGLSTSGNSENVIRAFQTARQKKMICIGLTGQSGGKMKDHADYLIAIPSTNTPRIQEAHMLLGHIICQLVEEVCFPES